jgi:hypothetical protein
LTWSHLDLNGQPDIDPPVPPHAMVWRSVRVGGDTKTRKSRRTVALPARCVEALLDHRDRQATSQRAAGERWVDKTSSSPAPPAPRSTRPTSAAGSAASPPRPGSMLPNGHPANCATASCRCSPTLECPSNRSPAWSGTPVARLSQRPFIASNCAQSSWTAPPSWIVSSVNVETARPATRRHVNSLSAAVPPCASRLDRLRSSRRSHWDSHALLSAPSIVSHRPAPR